MKTTDQKRKYCRQPRVKARRFNKKVTASRQSFIVANSSKWVNGTILTYAFIEGSEPQKKVVRQAFDQWKKLGIGIAFKEVKKNEETLLRIGFDYSDGSWSYVGRENLEVPKTERTMNFGWDLTADAYGMTTALHEIGHAIGFQHEHQSPFAGITWDKTAVYKAFSAPPNQWKKAQIDSNIINKLSANQAKGSAWDPKSIMQYEFGPGLVLQPVKYKAGIFPPGMLSASDIKGVKFFYPEPTAKAGKKIGPNKPMVIQADTGKQDDFIFVAPATAKYTFQTVGELDTVMVIFEKEGAEKHYMAGDDDSGLEKNAKIALPLVKGRSYLVNIRVLYAPAGKSGSLLVN